jgi:hypothetical protein
MHAIKATWTNGQIVPAEPVDWPEGSELIVEPLVDGETAKEEKLSRKYDKIGVDESEWDDSPEGIAEWRAWLKTIEPLEYTDQELAELERYREEYRRFNIEAVRKQMGLEET